MNACTIHVPVSLDLVEMVIYRYFSRSSETLAPGGVATGDIRAVQCTRRSTMVMVSRNCGIVVVQFLPTVVCYHFDTRCLAKLLTSCSFESDE